MLIKNDALLKNHLVTIPLSFEKPTEEDRVNPDEERQENVFFWRKWLVATKNILPTFLIVHTLAFLISCAAGLFTVHDYSVKRFPIYTLWQQWGRWDALQFVFIADNGYTYRKAAFFPLYPFLIKGVKHLTHNNSLVAGMLIANLAGFVMLVVLYQLVSEEFGKESAQRTVLYLSMFPAAFFLMAAYNESLFLCFTLMLFYFMRHKHWWLAGICGFFAMLTRSVSILLVVPFLYEYLRQHQFQLRKIRFDILSISLIPVALLIYGSFCYYRFGDFFAFADTQIYWSRHLVFPGYNLLLALKTIVHSSGILSFYSLRTIMDIVPDLFVGLLLTLALVGPWRFKRSQMVYVLYAWLIFIYAQIYPVIGTDMLPLSALSRYLLEVFPAFIVLGTIGRHRTVNQGYLLLASGLFFFLLTQFLLGHLVI